ncbi:hypothetical protein WKW50_23600 [Ochrobactrum sp. GPK 3]|uniref:hypothetical protein n=1 Tax=Brucella sp. 22210 TaxID=3453892 RepID=UPI0031385FCC
MQKIVLASSVVLSSYFAVATAYADTPLDPNATLVIDCPGKGKLIIQGQEGGTVIEGEIIKYCAEAQ